MAAIYGTFWSMAESEPGVYRKRDVVLQVRQMLEQQNGNWKKLLDLICFRTLAGQRNNKPISSESIAESLELRSDRTIRDDSKRIHDLLEFLFSHSQTLYTVSLALAEGRPRDDGYHRLYTFEISPNATRRNFH